MSAGRPRVAGLLVLVLGVLLAGCASSDDARVLQVLNQRGFGRPTQDANRRYYIGIGDRVVIQSTYKEYNGVSETVRMDGTITLPDVGEIYVNGLTPEEATEVVRQRYDLYVVDTTSFGVRVVSFNSKQYYITGAPPRAPRAIKFRGDTTLLDALIGANFDEHLVDTDDILVIRGDPENPLAISCDYNAIKTEGLTRDNILIRENDIIYLTPSILGYITWGVSALLSPLKPVQQLIKGTNSVVATFDTFGQPQGGKFNKFNNNNFGF